MASNPAGTTVILIRHAERNDPTLTDQDPRLNAAGRARAQKLIHVLGNSGIEAIYTSHFRRSKETAQPLTAHLGAISTPQIDEAAAIRDDILANHRGKAVLVVGHTDTVPALINLLSGGSMGIINDKEFDNLFVVTVLGPGMARSVRLKYGDQS